VIRLHNVKYRGYNGVAILFAPHSGLSAAIAGMGAVWNTDAKLVGKKCFVTTDPYLIRHLRKIDGFIDYEEALGVFVTSVKNQIDLSKNHGNPDQIFDLRGHHKSKPYQTVGLEYIHNNILEDGQMSVLISDEMGLGKTIEAIMAICSNKLAADTALIVCNATPKRNWYKEIKKFATIDKDVGIAEGGYFPDSDLVIINYDIVSRHRDEIYNRRFDMIVLDECHKIKNPKAARTRAIIGEYSRGQCIVPPLDAPYKIAMSGTPIHNRVRDLWPILFWLNPGGWPSFFKFAQRYCGALRSKFGYNYDGSSNLQELGVRLRSTIMIRRMKSDCEASLPDKIRQPIEFDAPEMKSLLKQENDIIVKFNVDTSELQKKAAEAIIYKDMTAYKNAMSELSKRLRRELQGNSEIRKKIGLAKVPYIVSHINDCIESGVDKMVVFAHHRDVLHALINKYKDTCVSVMGGDSQDSRNSAVNRFVSDPKCNIFFGSLMAASEAITLVVSSHVIFAELDYSPMVMAQAEDRVHRIGQTKNPLIQYMVVSGSLDARMIEVMIEKQEAADGAIDTKMGIIDDYLCAGMQFDSLPRTVEVEKDASAVLEVLPSSLDVAGAHGESKNATVKYMLQRIAYAGKNMRVNPVEQVIASRIIGFDNMNDNMRAIAKNLCRKYFPNAYKVENETR
jgi:SWI/SNF-related matrix-associated actin-dependent regulator of chromatin subfamily A-like protein 1